ncbi:MAG: bacteriocin [Lachnospiraceae bacterium]|nr:bacteriocin [Lachnospiraceae bacterium]
MVPFAERRIITMKNLDEKDLKKVNGGAEEFELHPEDPELDGRLIVKTGPEGKKGPGKGEEPVTKA